MQDCQPTAPDTTGWVPVGRYVGPHRTGRMAASRSNRLARIEARARRKRRERKRRYEQLREADSKVDLHQMQWNAFAGNLEGALDNAGDQSRATRKVQ